MSTHETFRPASGDATSSGGRTTRQRRRLRSWRLDMPAGQQLLNSNQRLHWAAKARITKQLRSDAYLIAKYAKVPHLHRAHITCLYMPAPVRPVRDEHNLFPSAKALVDGVVDAGVLTDDSHEYLTGPDMRRSTSTCPGGRLVLIIHELETPHEPPHPQPATTPRRLP